jgi:hypothetical protein
MLEKSAPACAFGENRARFVTSLSGPQIEEATRAVSALAGEAWTVAQGSVLDQRSNSPCGSL